MLVFLGSILLQPSSAGAVKAAIMLSRNIHPYMLAVEGLEAAWSEQEGLTWEVLPVKKKSRHELEKLADQLRGGDFDLAVCIGPEATSFVHGKAADLSIPSVYSMVLNPDKLMPASAHRCGISLFIPIEKQLQAIQASIPNIQRLGLLYTPEHNQDFVRRAVAEAAQSRTRIVPLSIASQEYIPRTLRNHWDRLDALWLIPDRTVISKALVEYIIKEAIYEDVPVIGYNRFFYQTGAAMAFVFDYKAIGAQTARLALQALQKGVCPETSPAYEVKLNASVLDRLRINPEGRSGERRQ
jgi:putative ABC transport system substrate-binding protein